MDVYAARKNLAPSLWKDNKMDDVLDLLNKEQMRQSALQFPLSRNLKPTERFVNFSEESEGLYDPCFLLPLFNYLLSPGLSLLFVINEIRIFKNRG